MTTTRILAAIVILLIGSGCESGKTTNIPDSLVGVWETSAIKYKDRYLEFKKDVVIFGTGDGDQTIQFIRKVKAERQDQKDLYTVTYLDEDGGEISFSFFYDPAVDVIALKNQEDIEWKKNSGKTD
jgi:hypothetical protein